MEIISCVREAIYRGYERLNRLSYYGLWQGFPTLGGKSSTWVTGFVAAHLMACRTYQGDRLSSARALLALQNPHGGWSYAAGVPVDADSTAWCVMAVRASGIARDADLKLAEKVLQAHIGPKGAVTYRPDSGINTYIGVVSADNVVGWTSPHFDVTVAVLLAGFPPKGTSQAEDLLRRIVSEQSGDGYFESYWWRSPWYGATMLLRVIQSRSYLLNSEQLERILVALKRCQLPGGGYGLSSSRSPDPFNTALALEAMCRLSPFDCNELCYRTIESLLDTQMMNGGWQGDFVLQIPEPRATAPSPMPHLSHATRHKISMVKDTDGIFSTVLACYALDLWLASQYSGV